MAHTIKTQNWGIEIEMTGLSREKATQAVANVLGSIAYYAGTGYQTWAAKDQQGRTWKLMRDASIVTIPANTDNRVELVSPICKYEDIELVQQIIRALRGAGAKVNHSCGIHVHVDAASHTAKTLRNIANIITSKEDLIYKALNVDSLRANYCKKADADFINRINHKAPQTLMEMGTAWYNGANRGYQHYDSSRYHGLNLHSVWQKGTVEFRYFNSTLHAGEIKTYIQFCLAISAQALTVSRTTAKKTATTNDKFTFRVWLMRIGFIGDEFETARHHLLKNLTGDIAERYAA